MSTIRETLPDRVIGGEFVDLGIRAYSLLVPNRRRPDRGKRLHEIPLRKPSARFPCEPRGPSGGRILA
jgi:hypothetical protein